MASPKKSCKNKQNVSAMSPVSLESASANSQEDMDRLDRELSWCVEQLELGLQDKKATSKQINEARRALDVLQNPAVVNAKKRALMKSIFGDYRKKMNDELKQIDAKLKGTGAGRVEPVSVSKQSQVSTFYRKSRASASVVPKFYMDSAALADNSSSNFTFSFEPNQQLVVVDGSANHTKATTAESYPPKSAALDMLPETYPVNTAMNTESYPTDTKTQTLDTVNCESYPTDIDVKSQSQSKPFVFVSETFKKNPNGSSFTFSFDSSS